MAEKPHDVVVKFDMYRNVQRHRAVLPAIARILYVERFHHVCVSVFSPRRLSAPKALSTLATIVAEFGDLSPETTTICRRNRRKRQLS